jgi:hypothetical protein
MKTMNTVQYKLEVATNASAKYLSAKERSIH